MVKNLQHHPTLSARQLHEHLGDEAPHPRTIDRIRQRHRRGPSAQTTRPHAVHSAIHPRDQGSKPDTSSCRKPNSDPTDSRGTCATRRASWMSPTTMKRLKRAVLIETDPSSVATLGFPLPTGSSTNASIPHSLWHGDCLEKVILADTGSPIAYHLAFLDDYSRGYVFCDLFREVTTVHHDRPR